jgi:glycosyltransferase involved in cell wall biosynthesis
MPTSSRHGRPSCANFLQARLLVVGDGSLRTILERRAHDLKVGVNVMFAGYRSDMPLVLDAVDVVALPSIYEGMPLTAIEASAMARPVVATCVDGTPEVIRDGRTGRLVPARDTAALARALLGLLRDPQAAQRMGRAGRDYVLHRIDHDTQVQATARVYSSLAGMPQRKMAA